jgi:hypothetical protein
LFVLDLDWKAALWRKQEEGRIDWREEGKKGNMKEKEEET